jgi:mRNA interferase YafQ
MSELVLAPRFERAFRRLIRKNPALQSQIETTLRRLADNLNDPRLKMHHLSGQLTGLYACTAGYDYRIVFAKQKHPKSGAEVLLLINIGTHGKCTEAVSPREEPESRIALAEKLCSSSRRLRQEQDFSGRPLARRRFPR